LSIHRFFEGKHQNGVLQSSILNLKTNKQAGNYWVFHISKIGKILIRGCFGSVENYDIKVNKLYFVCQN
jgi:hypothetical protein